ncbi:hypothetical protein GCM10007103_07680 [Salinimicrobium marinum]|uniref:Uncharacterized protein n=1 Tax=Salinimicrobium marinum TaxID=680283 RepID=A0A918S7J6_9FLAO|nr:hypothetical protein GCM10007103_07680 [Salinimicrobium marinum]
MNSSKAESLTEGIPYHVIVPDSEGGIENIGKVTGKVVPVMAGIYIIAAFIVNELILTNWDLLLLLFLTGLSVLRLLKVDLLE